ncbi:hypothetical protein IAT40_004938 [Kwoniella sp. CBS 6097]
MEHESRCDHEGVFSSEYDNLTDQKPWSTLNSQDGSTDRHDTSVKKYAFASDDNNDHYDHNDNNDNNENNDAHSNCKSSDYNQKKQQAAETAYTTSIAAASTRLSLESALDNNQNPHSPSYSSFPIVRPSLPSRASSFSSDTDDSLPATPLSAKFSIDIEDVRNRTSCDTPRTSLDLEEIDQTPRKRSDSFGLIRAKGCVPHESLIRTPPNARLTKVDRELVSEPSASLLRPTTFWRHHPLSPHSLPHHSPSSRLIRRSLLIASPTIGIQQPDPDAETTRIAIGLAGLDLDIDPRRRGINLLPI